MLGQSVLYDIFALRRVIYIINRCRRQVYYCIILSVLLFTASDYPGGIFKLFSLLLSLISQTHRTVALYLQGKASNSSNPVHDKVY